MRCKATIMLWLLLQSLAVGRSQAGETAWEEFMANEAREEINRLIRNLAMPTVLRQEAVKALVAACRGRHAALARQEALAALDNTNPQIRAGVAEVMAEIGGEEEAAALARQLRYEPWIEVRHLLLQVMAIFLLSPGDETLRAEMVARLTSGQPMFTKVIRQAVRHPPWHQVTGEWDAGRCRRQNIAIAAISGQLDPVAEVISGLETKKDDTQVRLQLKRWFAKALGETRSEWEEQWQARGPEILGAQPSEIFPEIKKDLASVQIAAARLLVEIAAPVAEDTAQRLARLAAVSFLPTRQAALVAVADLGRLAREHWLAVASAAVRTPNADQAEEIRHWQQQRREDAERAIRLAFSLGRKYSEDSDAPVRAAACAALGAARLPAAADEEQTVAEAVALLREHLVRNDDLLVQIAVARALGNIGGQEALKTLIEITQRQPESKETLAMPAERQFFAAAMSAIAAIAETSGEAGSAACAYLCQLLADERPLPGKAEPGEPRLIRDLALRQLQEMHNLRDDSLDPETWLQRYESMRQKRWAKGETEEGP